MCGITGIVKLNHSPLFLREGIQRMTDTLRHRGPDGEGYLLAAGQHCVAAGGSDTQEDNWKSTFPFSPKTNIQETQGDYTLAFGHRRLSIIDLSPSGHQPMCTPDRNIWITYNGEIYNYRELREELKQKGYVFHTESDTEVILAAYLEWGENCLQRFNGMWAFVLYNRSENYLFGARDRVGVKPFYYYSDNDVFAFASEQKALVKLSFVKTGINPAAVFDFFTTGDCEHEEEGMFSNILELFPSHSFRLNLHDGKFSKKRYYSLAETVSNTAISKESFPGAVSKTQSMLIQAVSLRMRSDVPVGACLSGGIDSSVITGIIRHLLQKKSMLNIGEQLKVFTASFPGNEIDESNYAKIAAEAAGAKWLQVFPQSAELLNDLESLTYSQDIPLWSTSTYAQHRVMKLAADSGIKVVLDGQGADELFAGYHSYNFYYWMELLKQGKLSLLKQEMKTFPGSDSPLKFFIRQYLRFKGMENIPGTMKPLVYKTYFKDLQYLQPDFWNTHKHRLGNKQEKQPGTLNEALVSEFYNKRLKTYLKCEDRCSMWHSVESRTPFADDRGLIEFVSGLPSEYKINNSINKHLLREAAREFLPDSIYRRRDKKGFSTPNNQWISEIKDQVMGLFEGEIKNYIDTEKLKSGYRDFFSQENKPDSIRIFKYISFAQWVKTFFPG